MKNPLIIEDIEFIENNIMSIRSKVGFNFQYYIDEWLSEKTKFNFWAFFLAPFWLGAKGMFEYVFLYCILTNLFVNRIPVSYTHLCDSDIASSVPLSPRYLVGTTSRLISSPGASSPIATDTPPAPKSLHFLIILVTSGFLNNL